MLAWHERLQFDISSFDSMGKPTTADVEEAPLPPASGYDRLGKFMGELPDSEGAIFRRFGALAAEDLLYRQAELVEIEMKLRAAQEADRDSGHEYRKHYSQAWRFLEDSVSGHNGHDPTQMRTILDLRLKLESYRMLHCPPL
jgi:hypothetical protein